MSAESVIFATKQTPNNVRTSADCRRTVCIIPARYGSSRFPGKPLAMLQGRPIIEWVCRAASACIADTYVATDDERIAEAVRAFGGRAVMTRSDHNSGTNRIAEALETIGGEWDVVVNVQGDEPFVCTEMLTTLCRAFDDSDTEIATLAKRFGEHEDVRNPNAPKVVTDNLGRALYFSRSAIPFVRDAQRPADAAAFPFLKHIGIYAYRQRVLRQIVGLPQSPLEKAERLEQLRWLQSGYRIRVMETEFESIGIDTPEDLTRAAQWLAQRSSCC